MRLLRDLLVLVFAFALLGGVLMLVWIYGTWKGWL